MPGREGSAHDGNGGQQLLGNSARNDPEMTDICVLNTHTCHANTQVAPNQRRKPQKTLTLALAQATSAKCSASRLLVLPSHLLPGVLNVCVLFVQNCVHARVLCWMTFCETHVFVCATLSTLIPSFLLTHRPSKANAVDSDALLDDIL